MRDIEESRLWLAHHNQWSKLAGDGLGATLRRFSATGHFCAERLRRLALTLAATVVVAATMVAAAAGPALV